MLAGVSVDYDTKLERGKITSASDSVLEAIARALQLDDAERTLFGLFRSSIPAARTARPAPTALRESLQRMLDSMAVPAVAYNARQDIVGANLLGRAMFSQAFESDRPNLARYIVLDPRSRDFFRRLGPRVQPHRRHAPLHRRPGSPQRFAHRPRRRALRPQPRVPVPLGSPGRARAPPRPQSLLPPRGRRARSRLRRARRPRRARPVCPSPRTRPPAGTPTAEKFALLASWTASGTAADE